MNKLSYLIIILSIFCCFNLVHAQDETSPMDSIEVQEETIDDEEDSSEVSDGNAVSDGDNNSDEDAASNETNVSEGSGNDEGIDYSQVKQYEIGSLTTKGTQYLNESIIKNLSGLQVGDRITIPGEDIQMAIKNLWEQGLFSNVEINATKVINDVIFLEIGLTERPRLSKYKFTGVRKSEEDDIRDIISLTRGRVLTENVKMLTINAVENYFVQKGFLFADAKITSKDDPDRANHIVVDIDVKRGEKIKIQDINFTGNEAEYDRQLKKAMRNTKEKSKVKLDSPKEIYELATDKGVPYRLGNLTWKGFYNFVDERVQLRIFNPSKYLDDEYQMDKEALIAYYNTRGYRDAKIVSDTLYAIDDRHINIDIKVDEGKKYYFRNIEWEGNTKYSNEQLAKILNIQKGEVYDQSRLDEGLSVSPNGTDVSALYMDDGYLFFSVIPTEKTVDGDSIDLTIKIQEGPQATINKVTIVGNTKTNEHVIRREIRTLPGNKFSRSDIIRTQRELAALGYFDPEQLTVNPIPDPVNGTVDIEYGVAERPSDQFELSAGWGGRSIVGSIGLTFNNFSLREIFSEWDPVPSGDGQRLSLRFQSSGPQFQSLNASFTEPWLGGKQPTSFTVAGFSSLLSNGIGKWGEADFAGLLTNGVTVGIGKRLKRPDDFFTLSAELNYQNYRLENYQSNFIVSDGRFNNLSLRLTLARFSVGINPVYPTEGSNISFSVQLTPPYSSFNNKDYTDLTLQEKFRWTEYHKWKFKAEWFTRIKGDLVLRTSAKMGFMGFYNSQIGQNPFERFELGDDGLTNFNLYGRDVIALRGYEVISTPIEGDPFYDKFTLELRYPFSTNPNSTIYALTFLEGGNSWSSFKDWNAFQIRRSAGVGLRFFLPMFGTIGFDYGVGFDKNLAPATSFWDYVGRYGKFSVVLGQEPE